MAVDPITAGMNLVSTAIDKIWPDKSEQEKQQLAAQVAIVNGQLAINQEEAKNPSVFVSGWRPFIGWVCGLGCGWNWIGLPITSTIMTIAGHPVVLSMANLTEMLPLLLGMLGLGGLRTYEKINDVART